MTYRYDRTGVQRGLLAAALLCAALPALAKCAPSAKEGVSANKQVKVVPTTEGQITFYRLNAATNQFDRRAQGKLPAFGHHITTYVSDDGAYFVLHDFYIGVVLGKTDGTGIKTIRAEEMLTQEENRKRPGKWTCHVEGVWSRDKNMIAFSPDSKSVEVLLYTGRKVVLRLDTGKGL